MQTHMCVCTHIYSYSLDWLIKGDKVKNVQSVLKGSLCNIILRITVWVHNKKRKMNENTLHGFCYLSFSSIPPKWKSLFSFLPHVPAWHIAPSVTSSIQLGSEDNDLSTCFLYIRDRFRHSQYIEPPSISVRLADHTDLWLFEDI